MVQIKSVDKPATEHWEVIVLTKGGGAIELLYPSRQTAEGIIQALRNTLQEEAHAPALTPVFFAHDMRGLKLEVIANQVAGWILRPVRPSALGVLISSLADQEPQPGG